MSNWTSITADDLKAITLTIVTDKAETYATGAIDPIAEALAEGVARVRRAVATGNALDQDTSTVPVSLKGVALRIAKFNLMERIRLPLNEDERTTRDNDVADLKRIADNKIRVEVADNPLPDGAAIQRQPAPSVTTPNRKFTDRTTDGI